MASTCCELVWLKRLLMDFGISHSMSTLLFCDNESAVKIASNPTFHECKEHIDIDCHFIREKVEDKTIKLMPVHFELQIANMFTKPLPTSKLIPFMSKLSLKNIYSSDKA